MGRKVPSDASSFFVSDWWPTRTADAIPSTEMKRAKTCACVTNSSVDVPGPTTSFMTTRALRHSSTKFECVIIVPLGRPVEPEV